MGLMYGIRTIPHCSFGCWCSCTGIVCPPRCLVLCDERCAVLRFAAAAAVGISPVGIDLSKVTGLWDAAAAAGKEGKEAALAAAMEALQSPAPASTQPRAGGWSAEARKWVSSRSSSKRALCLPGVVHT